MTETDKLLPALAKAQVVHRTIEDVSIKMGIDAAS